MPNSKDKPTGVLAVEWMAPMTVRIRWRQEKFGPFPDDDGDLIFEYEEADIIYNPVSACLVYDSINQELELLSSRPFRIGCVHEKWIEILTKVSSVKKLK